MNRSRRMSRDCRRMIFYPTADPVALVQDHSDISESGRHLERASNSTSRATVTARVLTLNSR